MRPLRIAEEDPRRHDIVALLAAHLSWMHEQSPPEDVHALDVVGLTDPAVSFFSGREGGKLVAIGALRQLDDHHAEIKSMHTVPAARRRGLAAEMLRHLVATARTRGYRRLSLETGSSDAFAPARALYRNEGFVECGAFGEYQPSAHSTFMTLVVK